METEMTTRKLQFDRNSIYNAVVYALRRRRIRDDLLGYDLIKGSIFGKIRHPEKDTETIIREATENCSLPSNMESYEDGMNQILESLEVVMDITASEFENLKLVEKLLNSTAEEVKKELCHSKSRDLVVGPSGKEITLAQNIIMDLVYKKLVNDESTWECMYAYAAKKISFIDDSNVDKEEIQNLASEAVPKGMTLEEYVELLVDEAYKKDK
jgi:hypothetical protein